jgi:hypothetical protein
MGMQEVRGWDYFVKRSKEEPLVPIGAAVTVFFLAFGLNALRNNNKTLQSRAMKGRVIAQGVTAVAVMFGIMNKIESRKTNPKPTLEDTITKKVEENK